MAKSERFEKKARTTLDESLKDLSPDITRRLQQARYTALEKAKPRTFWSFYPQALTAVIAIAVVSASVFFSFNPDDTTETVIAMEAEMEMLTSNDNLELLEELEFIQWLVETEEYAS